MTTPRARPDGLLSGLLRETPGRARALTRGEALFHRDDPGTFVFAVQTGLIEISVTSPAGRKSVLAHCGPGEVVGEISVLDGLPRSADAVALKPTTGRIVTRPDLLARVTGDAAAISDLVSALCARIRNASDVAATQAMTQGAARLAACLVRLADKWGEATGSGAIVISEPFSQSELGAFAGLARETVSRHIGRWSAEDVIVFDGGRIEVLDLARLTELAETDG